MSTTATAPMPMVAQLLQTLDHEHKTTLKVLKAVPADKLDFKPHERSWPAGQLAWHVAYAPYGLANIIASAKFDGYQQPPTPDKLDDIVAGAVSFHEKAKEVLASLTPEQLQKSIPLPNGQSIPCGGFLWSGVVFHTIHHRGQLSVYVRMMGGKVPSIYGPSADDNPFA
jgi:uncharacterized damage-inducible protein DinB